MQITQDAATTGRAPGRAGRRDEPVRTYRILLEADNAAPAAEVSVVVRDADRARELALGFLLRDKSATAADIFEGGRKLAHITRADPGKA